MTPMDALCEGLGGLLRAGASRRPVNTLAVILSEGDGDALLVVANALGVAAFRGPRAGIPAIGDGPVDLDLASRPDGFLERRLLLTGFSDDLRGSLGVVRARALGLRGREPRAEVVLGTADSTASAAGLDEELKVAAEEVSRLLQRSES